MKAGKVLTMKAVALGVAVMFIVASCGGSDSASGGKTKNSALCFPTQADKDAAIADAQAALDAANATTTSGASGGYRRPAVRSMSGDTTVPPDSTIPAVAESVDTTVPASDSTVLSPTVGDSGANIPMLEQALLDAQNQPLCDAENASSAVTYPPEPASYNLTTQRVTAEQGYDLVIPEGGRWFHAEGFGDDGSCYLDDYFGVWAALVVTDSAGSMVIRDMDTVNAENCIGANITVFLPAGTYLLSASTGDMQYWGSYGGFTLDFNLTFGLGDAAENAAPAELPKSGTTPTTVVVELTPDTLPVEILGGVETDTTTSTTVAEQTPDTTPATTVAGQTPDTTPVTTVAGQTPDTTPATTVAGQTPDTTPATTTLPAVTTEVVAIPAGISEFTCDADCVATLFKNFGFADGEITLSAGAEEVTVKYGDQSAAVKVGTRAQEIKVSAVSASGKKVEKSVGVKVASKPDAPWVAPGSAAAETSTSGSSKSIYIYVLIALLILVAIGYMRRKKAAEAK
jgi:hypothetical protein